MTPQLEQFLRLHFDIDAEVRAYLACKDFPTMEQAMKHTRAIQLSGDRRRMQVEGPRRVAEWIDAWTLEQFCPSDALLALNPS